MRERDFQRDVIRDLKDSFPDCIVMKNDPTYIQGIPDLLVLWGERWAALECKNMGRARHQPNQEYYVRKMDEMSFAAFIYPENWQEVLDELERFFER